MSKSSSILKLWDIPKTSHSQISIAAEEYTVIPDRFVDLKSWPKKCNRLCYFCTNVINHVPLFVPADIGDEIERKDKILVCTPSCLFAYITKYVTMERDRYMRYSRELIRRISGIPINKQGYELTDDRQVLREYGGDVDRREYRESIYLKNKDYLDSLFSILSSIELGR